MNADLSRSAQRVQDALLGQGVDCVVVELPQMTRTANEAARAIGCTVGQIVKSLLFEGRASGEPLLALVSGVNRVDEKQLGTLIGESIRRPNAAFVRQKTGFAIGGVPPLGHPAPLRTFIDRSLLQYDVIWAAAGTPFAVFQLTPKILLAITDGTLVDFG